MKTRNHRHQSVQGNGIRNRLAGAFAVLALLATLALAGSAAAQGPGRGARASAGWGDGAWSGRGCLAGLELTEEQQQRIDDIREKGREEVAALRLEQARVRNEIHGEMLTEQPSTDRLNTLVRQLGDLRDQLQMHRLEQQLAVREVLTPEQRDAWLMRGGFAGAGTGLGRRAHRGCAGWGDGCGAGCGHARGDGWGRGCGHARGDGWGRGCGHARGDQCGPGCGHARGDQCGPGCGRARGDGEGRARRR